MNALPPVSQAAPRVRGPDCVRVQALRLAIRTRLRVPQSYKEMAMRFFDLFTRRSSAHRDAVEPRMAGRRAAASRACGRTRLSVICEQSHVEAVRRCVCTGFMGTDMAVVRLETLPGMPHGKVHLCFSIEYAPERRKRLIELAGEIARDPRVARACFGMVPGQALQSAA